MKAGNPGGLRGAEEGASKALGRERARETQCQRKGDSPAMRQAPQERSD